MVATKQIQPWLIVTAASTITSRFHARPHEQMPEFEYHISYRAASLRGARAAHSRDKCQDDRPRKHPQQTGRREDSGHGGCIPTSGTAENGRGKGTEEEVEG